MIPKFVGVIRAVKLSREEHTGSGKAVPVDARADGVVKHPSGFVLVSSTKRVWPLVHLRIDDVPTLTISHILLNHITGVDIEAAAATVRRLFAGKDPVTVTVVSSSIPNEILKILCVGVSDTGGWVTVVQRVPKYARQRGVYLSVAVRADTDTALEDNDFDVITFDMVGATNNNEVDE